MGLAIKKTEAEKTQRTYARLAGSLSLGLKTSNNGARVGSAMTYMLSAREWLEFALPLMKAVAADPLAVDTLQEHS
jgi:hypothetical protein